MPNIETTIADVKVSAHTFAFISPAMTDRYNVSESVHQLPHRQNHGLGGATNANLAQALSMAHRTMTLAYGSYMRGFKSQDSIEFQGESVGAAAPADADAGFDVHEIAFPIHRGPGFVKLLVVWHERAKPSRSRRTLRARRPSMISSCRRRGRLGCIRGLSGRRCDRRIDNQVLRSDPTGQDEIL